MIDNTEYPNYLHLTVDSEHCYHVASRELDPSFYVLEKHDDVLEQKSAKRVDTGVEFLEYPKHLQCMQLMVKQYRKAELLFPNKYAKGDTYELKNLVICNMIKDDITQIASSDELITTLGSFLSSPYFSTYENHNKIIEGVTTKHIGYTLYKCIQIFKDQGNVSKLYNLAWSIQISSVSLRTLASNKFNKVQFSPLAEDLIAVQSYLLDKIPKLTSALAGVRFGTDSKIEGGFVKFHMCCVHIALICDILWFTIKKLCAHSTKVNLQNKKRTIKNGLLCHNIQSKTLCEICGLIFNAGYQYCPYGIGYSSPTAYRVQNL